MNIDDVTITKVRELHTMKRKASIMVILATASWKSLWMTWPRTFEKRVLMGSVITDHMVMMPNEDEKSFMYDL